jgi:hypothetical protein
MREFHTPMSIRQAGPVSDPRGAVLDAELGGQAQLVIGGLLRHRRCCEGGPDTTSGTDQRTPILDHRVADPHNDGAAPRARVPGSSGTAFRAAGINGGGQ